MAEAKKTKTYFHSYWEEDYFFCLVKFEVRLSYLAFQDKSYDVDFLAKSALCTQKVQELKGHIASQQPIFARPNTKGKAATIASYRVSPVLAKHKKSFKDSEVVKEALVEATDALFGDFKNKSDIVAAIKDVQLSRGTVTR